MKKFLIIFIFIIFYTFDIKAESIDDKFEYYKQNCYSQAYPSDEKDETYTLYNDKYKEATQKYNFCIKEIISSKISQLFEPEYAAILLENLQKSEIFQLSFYDGIFNHEDNGTYGKLYGTEQVTGSLENMLKSIILYQTNYR